MADNPAYTAELAGQLRTRRPDLLELAEDELQVLRRFKNTVTGFLRNETVALDIRQGLARDLHLREPDR